MTKDPQRTPEAAPAEAGTSNADKARALIALLESGGGAAAEGIPAARLRDWARDLVETVERSAAPASGPASAPPSAPVSAPPAAAPAPASAAKQEPRLTASRSGAPRLFTKAAPVLVDRAPSAAIPAAIPVAGPAEPSVPPAAAAPAAAPPPAYRPGMASVAASTYEAARAPAARAMPGVPVPHVPPRPQAGTSARPAILPRPEVDRIVASTVDMAGDPAALGREHPAIVALTLLGKPTIQQAAALRALPGPQMRAVHRALRLLEAQER